MAVWPGGDTECGSDGGTRTCYGAGCEEGWGRAGGWEVTRTSPGKARAAGKPRLTPLLPFPSPVVGDEAGLSLYG